MNTLDLEIQSLTHKHLSALLQLDQACFGGLWTLDAYERELDSPNTFLLGSINPNSLDLSGMGCFWSILDEAHITILAVHPQYQNQGLGQALLFSLLKTAYEQGLERATLEVRPSNVGAITLYQKFGFKTAGRRRRYYKDNDEDALILWLGDIQTPQFNRTLDVWLDTIKTRLYKSGWNLTFPK
ncbi:ribosomal-protein-alanine acetyltransferase [Calothrix sp. NIES-4071]|nr:ribosomal-protein-alanine acetyltransferase [Calothrix sp. NIES-4071]BAZ60388.1 ribosomal-protein-alanine acetyltransferase [Calothrix sp. NIES-4105]